MTRDELRGLIGGYATGTLSEAERKALFEAALDDQELFDELAREQALKEAIEEPGAKQRLLAAVAPKAASKCAGSKPWWRQTWSWAAIAAACVAIITGVVLLRPRGELQQLAQVERPALPEPPVIATTPATPPVATQPSAPVRAPATPVPAQKDAQTLTAGAAVEALKQAPAEAPRAESIGRLAPPEVRTGSPLLPSQATAPAAAPPPIPIPQAAPAPIPAPPTGPVAGTGPARALGFATNGAADALTVPAAPPAGLAGAVGGAVGGGGGGGGGIGGGIGGPAVARGGGGRGGRGGGRGGAARALAQPLAASPQPFAVDYNITAESELHLAPKSNGFLTVFSQHDGQRDNLFYNRAIQAGSPVDIPLPANCAAALFIFSAQPTPQGLYVVPTVFSPPSGSLTTPSGSPNRGFTIFVRVRP